jgi:hypothetical protein
MIHVAMVHASVPAATVSAAVPRVRVSLFVVVRGVVAHAAVPAYAGVCSAVLGARVVVGVPLVVPF